MIGKLEIVDLRELWKHEAFDFTTWLYENYDVLNDQIGLSLTPIEKEKSVGPFNADILAEDANGRRVIIENQLERTDHDHLGKLLTYLSNVDAKIAIWISTDPRPEHVNAINYLNEVVPQDTKFYLLRLQAFKIGTSEPAPLFTIEAGPSEERSAGGEVKKELAARDEKRYEFFQQLLTRCNQKTTLFSSISPVAYQSWVSTGAGKSGLAWSLIATKKTARVELFLCSPTAEVNKNRFDKLFLQKKQIEDVFGEPLMWEYNANRKQQYIRSLCTIGGLEDPDNWTAIQNDMIERLIKLEKAVRPSLKNIE